MAQISTRSDLESDSGMRRVTSRGLGGQMAMGISQQRGREANFLLLFSFCDNALFPHLRTIFIRWLSSTTQYIKRYKKQDREQQHKTSTQKKKRERHHGKNPDGSSGATYHKKEKAVNCNRYNLYLLRTKFMGRRGFVIGFNTGSDFT
ncbi:hypothetical protein AVEN_91937-1 [Araneus ventricosus]|uniref:Uncharacterized protein n=1 Tax=Araneus ventricosus TaxID=182803 RepID=A0A4Y2LQZ5_ARAVE|nr:hypothetical protein AVEN_91937-1 [Araneus ventricosus]